MCTYDHLSTNIIHLPFTTAAPPPCSYPSRYAALSSTGAGGGSVSNPDKISEGKVKTVTASQLIIDAGGHEMTFAISGDTNIVAKGASKATKAAGGSTTINTFVHTGDSVSVSYKDVGGKMMASEVRVRVANK